MDPSLNTGEVDEQLRRQQQVEAAVLKEEKRQRPRVGKKHRIGEVPDFTPIGISPRLMGIRLKPCGLCEVEFDERCFGGIVSAKAITEMRAKWGRTELKERDVRPANLYAPKHVCVFCSQFFGIERFDEAAIAGEAAEDASNFSQRAINRRVKENRKRDLALENRLAEEEAKLLQQSLTNPNAISQDTEPTERQEQQQRQPTASQYTRPISAGRSRESTVVVVLKGEGEADATTSSPLPAPIGPAEEQGTTTPSPLFAWRPHSPKATLDQIKEQNATRFPRAASAVARLRRRGPASTAVSHFASVREEKDFFNALLRRVAVQRMKDQTDAAKQKRQQWLGGHSKEKESEPSLHVPPPRSATPSLTQQLRIIEERHRRNTLKLLDQRKVRMEHQVPPAVLVQRLHEATKQRVGHVHL